MVEVSLILQAAGGFIALLILIALLRWTFPTGKSPQRARNVLRRPLAWVIVVVQILFAVCASWFNYDGCGAEDVCDSYTLMEAGLRFYLVLFLWAMANVILAIIWVSRRTCPRCGHTCGKAFQVCPTCRFNFAAPARYRAMQRPPPEYR